MGDDDGDERDVRAEADEEIEQVLARLGAATGDEAHVMDEHQRAQRRALSVERSEGHQQRTVTTLQQMVRSTGELLELGATNLGRQGRRGDRLALVGWAEAHGKQALVLRDAGEDLHHSGGVPAPNQVLDGLLDRVGDQRGPAVQVPHEPLQREPIDERHHRVGENPEGKE